MPETTEKPELWKTLQLFIEKLQEHDMGLKAVVVDEESWSKLVRDMYGIGRGEKLLRFRVNTHLGCVEIRGQDILESSQAATLCECGHALVHHKHGERCFGCECSWFKRRKTMTEDKKETPQVVAEFLNEMQERGFGIKSMIVDKTTWERLERQSGGRGMLRHTFLTKAGSVEVLPPHILRQIEEAKEIEFDVADFLRALGRVISVALQLGKTWHKTLEALEPAEPEVVAAIKKARDKSEFIDSFCTTLQKQFYFINPKPKPPKQDPLRKAQTAVENARRMKLGAEIINSLLNGPLKNHSVKVDVTALAKMFGLPIG